MGSPGIRAGTLLLARSLALLLTAAAPAAQESGPADLDEILAPILTAHDVPALAGAIVTPDGLAGIGAVGRRRAGGEEQVTKDDRWHLGSCTKAMTATLLAAFLDEGKIGWETTMATAFADFASLDEDWREVTLRQLLDHRAGAPAELFADGLWMRLLATSEPAAVQRRWIVETVLANGTEAAPGARFAYSNAGYILAGAIAERCGGAPWEELMQQRIFGPLGMASAGFGAPGDAAKVDQPWGHRREGNRLVPVPPGSFGSDNPSGLGPAGTVHCSLRDWARFVALHLRAGAGEPRLVSPATMELLHTPREEDGYTAGWLSCSRPWAGGPAFTHAGSNTMWFAVVWMAPARGFAVLAATNAGGPRGAAATDAAAAALIERWAAREAVPAGSSGGGLRRSGRPPRNRPAGRPPTNRRPC
ncbi:MAG: serine hydrolase domain-containing protein [Planctomycetota bacterium]